MQGRGRWCGRGMGMGMGLLGGPHVLGCFRLLSRTGFFCLGYAVERCVR